MPDDFRNAPWVDPTLDWHPLPVTPLPNRVLIDFATRCNLRCPKCCVWGAADATAITAVEGTMAAERIVPLLDQIAPAKPLMQPNMWGEPLLIPDLEAVLTAAKARGITVALNTNGLTLTEALAAFLVEAKVDSVFFSLDALTPQTYRRLRGVDRLDKVATAVERLLNARGTERLPRIGVSFTVEDDNRAEEAGFVDHWSRIVDCVRVSRLYQDGRFPGMAVPEVRRPCPSLYQTLPIHHDGSVTVCCLDAFRVTTFGNVFDSGAAPVWRGEALARIRYYHETNQWDKVPFCRPCNGWVHQDYQEETRDGLLIRRSPEHTYYNRLDRLDGWRPPQG